MVQSCSIGLNPNIKSCLVNLAPNWVNALSARSNRVSDICIEISWSDTSLARKKAYVGWSGAASGKIGFFDKTKPDGDVIELDATFGHALGLKDRQRVSVEFIRPPAMASRVDVEPVSEDDWEILTLHAGYLEEKLLSQVRVVYPGQIITVWIEGQAIVRLKVTATEPNEKCVRLGNDAEIVVAPRERRHKVNDEQVHEVVEKVSVVKQEAYLRCLPFEYLESTLSVDDDFLSIGLHSSVASRFPDIVYLSNTIAPQEPPEGKEEPVPTLQGVYVRCHPAEKVPPDHVIIGPELMQLLHAVAYDRLHLSTVTVAPTPCKSVVARRVRETRTFRGITIGGKHKAQAQEADKALIDDLHAFIEASAVPTMILTDKMVCHVPLLSTANGDDFDVVRVVLEYPGTGDQRYALIGAEDARSLNIEVGADYVAATETDVVALHSLMPTSLPHLGGIDSLLNHAQTYIRTRLGLSVLKSELRAPLLGGLLLHGGHGAGKTSIVQHLVYTLSRSLDSLAYCLMMPCSDYADERVSKIKEHWDELFGDALAHAPSVVVFDDLDRLIMGESEHMDTARYKQLAALFIDVALQAKRSKSVIFVATAQNTSNLHPMIMEAHIFDEVLQIVPPSKKERREIIKAIMDDGNDSVAESLKGIDLTSVASTTEGYLAADLKTLVERAVHAAAVRSLSNPTHEAFIVEQRDFEEAQKGYTPSSLRGVKLQHSETSWSDIGGLYETRRVLKETLEWPTKYAAIFANSPLRLRSGLLLYGYPGCGKTLLASAVAKECGLNFISVKGPELLNKYIGASEASIRDLFSRAQAARPCILFFDEFDSIAPKRGHDNTGVTDRVVNQLLTQMDGAEKVEGVYVLAATSRPDLIDAALLRPGRLDKSLLCGMPTSEERLDILNAVANKLDLEDVDLKKWAEKTDGYSGADLQALLYNAHLDAIHSQLGSVESKEKKTEKEEKTGVDFKLLSMKQSAKEPASTRLTAAERSLWATRLEAIQAELNKIDAGDAEKEINAAHHKTLITEHNVETAFDALRPSVSHQDRQRLEKVYVIFWEG
jgi:peroxin-1